MQHAGACPGCLPLSEPMAGSSRDSGACSCMILRLRMHVRHSAVPLMIPMVLCMPIRYLGLDVVRPVIANATREFANELQWTFAVHDFTAEPPPQADLLFCRDALQHLPLEEVRAGAQ